MVIHNGKYPHLSDHRRKKLDLQDLSTDAFSADTELDWGGVRLNPDEEYAAEISDGQLPQNFRVNKSPSTEKRSDFTKNARSTKDARFTWIGWAAFAAAIISLFMWPAVLGPLSAIAGFMAIRLGHRTVGIWSMTIGIISFVSAVVISPLWG